MRTYSLPELDEAFKVFNELLESGQLVIGCPGEKCEGVTVRTLLGTDRDGNNAIVLSITIERGGKK